MLEPPITNASLIPGVEAEYNRDAAPAHHHARRRSTQLPCSPKAHSEVHKRLPHLFGGNVPGVASAPADDESADRGSDDCRESDNDNPDRRSNLADDFLGRVNDYSRLIHAHTEYQLRRPSNGTLPSYRKTMHTFTLNQLNHHRSLHPDEHNGTLSAPSTSPAHSASPVLPLDLHAELNRLSLDEAPQGPVNSPVHGGGATAVLPGQGQEAMLSGIDFRKLRLGRRSVTEPVLPREGIAVVKARDFAAL